MILLTANNLWRQFDAGPVLRDVSLEIRTGQRIGLVGPNGAGKTTLLRLLAALDEPDKGTVDRHPNATVCLLQQQPNLKTERTLFEVARAPLEPLLDLQSEALGVAETLAATADGDRRRQLERRYDHLQHELQRLDAYHVDHRVEEVLEGLSFDRSQFDQPAGTLSGGQQSRLMLACLLLESADLMLLDEPSNHLDLPATAWLEQFLIRRKQAAVVVSHDRYFLDKVTTGTFELIDARVEAYTGNFSAYWRQREERIEFQRKTYEKQQQFIAKQEDFVRRYQYGQRHAQAKDRRKKIERIERVEKPREIPWDAMGFANGRRTGDWVIEARGISKGFDRLLFQDVDLQLIRGERLGILGPNGSGKTTLLRVLLGELEPDAGTVRHGANVDVGYFDQQLETLPGDKTVLEVVRPDDAVPTSTGQLRGLLARFGLDGELVSQKIENLSGGEKSRLALARLAASGANLLVLDEPTNHLDLWARASLEQSLQQFQGTIVFVSHDRYFLNQIADRLLVLEADRIRAVEGNYETYLHVLAGSPPRAGGAGGSTANAPSGPAAKKSGRSARPAHRPAKTRRRFPYRKVEDIEQDISEREAALEQCQERLANPDTYTDPQRAKELRRHYEQLQESLSNLYEHWEEAMERN